MYTDITSQANRPKELDMERKSASILALNLMRDHNLVGWTFRFDRAVRRFGQTTYDNHTITLSGPLTDGSVEAVVRNTVLHEIAHALIGPGFGHGITWRRQAAAIGCDAKRCVTLADSARVKPPLVLVCIPGKHVIKTAYRTSKISKTHHCIRHFNADGTRGSLTFLANK